MLVKPQTFQAPSLPQASFAKTRELRREIHYLFLAWARLFQTRAVEIDKVVKTEEKRKNKLTEILDSVRGKFLCKMKCGFWPVKWGKKSSLKNWQLLRW